MKRSIEVELFRVRGGIHKAFITDSSYGMNGVFRIPAPILGEWIRCIVSDGWDTGWEHVSVLIELIDWDTGDASDQTRVPTWEEMCIAKRTFWEPEETVVQFHPAEKDYVNQNPNVLHLWRNLMTPFTLPPRSLI